MSKIITGIDNNLISLNYEDVSEQSIIDNELFIKELIYKLKNDDKYTNPKREAEYQQLFAFKEQIDQIVMSLNIDNFDKVPHLIARNDQKINQFAITTSEIKVELEQAKINYQNELDDLKEKLQAANKQCEQYKTDCIEKQNIIEQYHLKEQNSFKNKIKKVIKTNGH